MDDKISYITKEVHEEFARRMEAENQRLEDENKRQNHRIDALEKVTGQINALAISVEKMATNMENMLGAIERQGNLIEKQNDRLDAMEKEPGKDFKQIKMDMIKTVLGGIVGAAVVAVIALL